MTVMAEWRVAGVPATYSFYLTAANCKRKPEVAMASAELADAITIAGPKGPETIKQMRDAGGMKGMYGRVL